MQYIQKLGKAMRHLLAREGLTLPPSFEYLLRGGHLVYARDHSVPVIGSPTSELLQALAGGAEAKTGTARLPIMVEKVALVAQATPTNGGLFSWQNPLDEKVMAAVLVNVTTAATGAANANIGKGTAAATDNDDLLDGKDVGTAAGLFSSIESDDVGTNGKAFQLVDENGGTTAFITGTASADSSGIVGNVYILFVPVT